MTGTVAVEVRRALGAWRWWLTLPLLAVWTVAAFRWNEVAADVFGNYDAQGDDQVLEQMGVLAGQRWTSGHALGQLLALVVGAGLAVEAFRRRGDRGRTVASPRTVLVARMLAAVLVSVALAATAVTVTAVLMAGEPIDTAPLEAAVLAHPERYPYALPPAEVHAGVRRAVLVGLAGFPLWAVVGVGVGVLVRRIALTAALGVAYHASTFFLAAFVSHSRLLVAAVPMVTHAAAVDVVQDRAVGGPATAVALAATGLLAVVLGWSALASVSRPATVEADG
ncbi:hypothetical protein [Micromonospora costi]|uniref:Uncharacterized protein n=1 Tax=Micromonospora costi TaxID=1530042 RepID=A0A3A9ZWR1_9ACTN|nr:hypothetical protein [Micromonospora costi]RKN52723.1 hypothetical protein D7193_23045 [Micromonospora costi]